MKTRVIAGVVVAGVLFAAALSGHPLVHYPLFFLFALLAGFEAFRLITKSGMPTYTWLGMAAGAGWLLYLLFPWFGMEGTVWLLGAFLLAVLLRQIFAGPEQAALRISGTVFGVLYVFVLFGFAFLLFNGGFPSKGMRLLEFVRGEAIVHNWHLVLFTIFLTKASDAGAYFCGNFFGKHKMAPKLSPGKTWEGTVGGLLIAVAAAFLYANVFLKTPYQFHAYPFTPLQVGISAVVIGVLGVFGDLAESLLKRSAGEKDSGQLAPGIGGALDMIDSTLFTFPAMFGLFLLWHG